LETEAATSAPSRSAIAMASSRVMSSSEPVKTTFLLATGLVEAMASIGSGVTCASSASRTSSLCFSAKKIGDGFRYHCAEPFDIVDLRAGLRALECSPLQ